MGSRARRPLLALLAALAAALAVTGCVSMPSAGPVLSYPVTQETGGQNGQNMQFIAQPPRNGWNPQQIVNGFLTAAAAFGNQAQVARQYLTPDESKDWNPSWGAYVYKTGPSVGNPVYQAAAPKQSAPAASPARRARPASRHPRRRRSWSTARSRRSCRARRNLRRPLGVRTRGSGPLPLQPGEHRTASGGSPARRRICCSPTTRSRTTTSCGTCTSSIRTTTTWCPTRSTCRCRPRPRLMNRLVNDLIAPPKDWLADGATQTAFPAAAKVGGAR